MVTKHFFKTLITFCIMIALGLVAVFLVSYADQRGKGVATGDQVAN
jgi:hypothetical protein